jgi:hypothetical protein
MKLNLQSHEMLVGLNKSRVIPKNFLLGNEIRRKTMAAPMTPVKCYSLGNICIVCGFSFISKRVDEKGNVKLVKMLDKKLRLTKERRETVLSVCKMQDDTCFPSDSGVCYKCFRALERVLKTEKEVLQTREKFRSSLRTTMTRLYSYNFLPWCIKLECSMQAQFIMYRF